MIGKLYLQMVSTSMPENPKALSPSTQMTRCPGLLSLGAAGATAVTAAAAAAAAEAFDRWQCQALIT